MAGTDPTSPLDLAGARVVVAGLGVSGRAALEVLAGRGAHVVPVDDASDEAVGSAEYLAADGLARADLVVASPGLAPHHSLLATAAERGLPSGARSSSRGASGSPGRRGSRHRGSP